MANPKWVTDELRRNYDRASTAGRKSAAAEPRALRARYDAKNDRVVIELVNGCLFAFPPALAQGLARARTSDLADVEVTTKGVGLHWPRLDADLSVPGLIAGLFGSSVWMRELGRRGGAARTYAKTAAARENGKKGGRPSGVASKRRAATLA